MRTDRPSTKRDPESGAPDEPPDRRAPGIPPPGPPAASRPRLAAHLRLKFDAVRGQYVLLGPESVSVLNRTAADILRLCDGSRSASDIEKEMRRRYGRVPAGEVPKFLARLETERCLEIDDG